MAFPIPSSLPAVPTLFGLCSNLKFLHIGNSANFNDNSLAMVAKYHPRLRGFCAVDCPSLTSRSIGIAAMMLTTSLQSLSLQSTTLESRAKMRSNLGQEGNVSLSYLTYLEELVRTKSRTRTQAPSARCLQLSHLLSFSINLFERTFLAGLVCLS